MQSEALRWERWCEEELRGGTCRRHVPDDGKRREAGNSLSLVWRYSESHTSPHRHMGLGGTWRLQTETPELDQSSLP